ncbi:hypothetical protein K435DRAFT_875884 [Dendrothele bispora CBS 962.96]|uniref:Uncharacterized protein n=1 Tax=Dendrothele bispora (strain CBS 962.96) TaxID=1314807 RepID=A0A4S8KUF5_DENBC|nr:hypothetical protein K435DRAFT_875884 [Dendrothele bispora CBS 962.96]
MISDYIPLSRLNYRAHLRHAHEQNMRANQRGIELVVLPNSPMDVPPSDESRVVRQANFRTPDRSKEQDEDTKTEHPDLTPGNEGRDMTVNGITKSVTVHFHGD